MALMEMKHDRANQNLQSAEAQLKSKDEDLRLVQMEFDAVMAERQVSS